MQVVIKTYWRSYNGISSAHHFNFSPIGGAMQKQKRDYDSILEQQQLHGCYVEEEGREVGREVRRNRGKGERVSRREQAV